MLPAATQLQSQLLTHILDQSLHRAESRETARRTSALHYLEQGEKTKNLHTEKAKSHKYTVRALLNQDLKPKLNYKNNYMHCMPNIRTGQTIDNANILYANHVTSSQSDHSKRATCWCVKSHKAHFAIC